MARLDERIISALKPDREHTRGDEISARFLIRAWVWATPIILVLLVTYLVNGLEYQAINQVFTIAVGAGLLWTYKLGAPVRVLRVGSLGWTGVSFAISAVAQSPWDVSALFFLTIVPMAGVLVGGLSTGWKWALVSVALGLTVIWLGRAGLTLPDVDPTPTLTIALNFIFNMTLSLVVAHTWAEERARALSKVQAADRAKSVFLANVSHEIRTPMNGIVGMTELLLEGDLSAEQRNQLEVVQRSGHSLVLLINDLLDLARLEEGRFELMVGPFDVRALASDVVKLYTPLAAEQGLHLELDVGRDVPQSLRGDALRLRQVLSNLLSNAVKFTHVGAVRVEVSREGERTRFAVADSGPGIGPELRARLFQRFEQGDTSARRKTSGTGLGLALSHDFVQRMGGALELDERHQPGSRFTFSLALPTEDAPATRAPVSLKAPELEALSGRVLVVDDNAINLAVARGLVMRAGFEVGTALNGREALERVQASSWDLVLMDLQMPEMDGLEASRCIRALEGVARDVPIIALTASAMPTDFDACRAAGMNDVLAKPIDVRALAALLQQYGRRA